MSLSEYLQYVVKILNPRGNGIAGAGLLVVIDSGIFVITCWHVIKDYYDKDKEEKCYNPVKVSISHGLCSEKEYSAAFQDDKSNPKQDIAVLKLNVEKSKQKFPTAPLSEAGEDGDTIKAFGYQYQQINRETDFRGFTGYGRLTNGIALKREFLPPELRNSELPVASSQDLDPSETSNNVHGERLHAEKDETVSALIVVEGFQHNREGLSGAPAFNSRTGKIIGIIVGGFFVQKTFRPEEKNTTFLIPLKSVLRKWNELSRIIPEEMWLDNLFQLRRSNKISSEDYHNVLESSCLLKDSLLKDYLTNEEDKTNERGEETESEEEFFLSSSDVRAKDLASKNIVLWDSVKERRTYLSLEENELHKLEIVDVAEAKTHQIKCALRLKKEIFKVKEIKIKRNILEGISVPEGGQSLEFIYVPPGKFLEYFNPHRFGFYITKSPIDFSRWKLVTEDSNTDEDGISPSDVVEYIKNLLPLDQNEKFNLPSVDEISFASSLGFLDYNSKLWEVCLSKETQRTGDYLLWQKNRKNLPSIQGLTVSQNFCFRICYLGN